MTILGALELIRCPSEGDGSFLEQIIQSLRDTCLIVSEKQTATVSGRHTKGPESGLWVRRVISSSPGQCRQPADTRLWRGRAQNLLQGVQQGEQATHKACDWLVLILRLIGTKVKFQAP